MHHFALLTLFSSYHRCSHVLNLKVQRWNCSFSIIIELIEERANYSFYLRQIRWLKWICWFFSLLLFFTLIFIKLTIFSYSSSSLIIYIWRRKSNYLCFANDVIAYGCIFLSLKVLRNDRELFPLLRRISFLTIY